ncbi:MAG: hypothetical protein QOJ06_13 [Pseudonocardiales bacterium]|nr:hypothetical protein [Pseudonocardiales bacterium]
MPPRLDCWHGCVGAVVVAEQQNREERALTASTDRTGGANLGSPGFPVDGSACVVVPRERLLPLGYRGRGLLDDSGHGGWL